MRKISDKVHHEDTTYHREFRMKAGTTPCFAFPCDAAGTVDVEALGTAAQINYRNCLSADDIVDAGIGQDDYSWTDPAVWVCCDTEFPCDRFTNTCPDCGADYNSAGQQLADRSQWGEETNESLDEILAIDGTSTDELMGGPCAVPEPSP